MHKLCSIPLLLCSSLVLASEPNAVTLDPIVIVASRIEQPMHQVGSSVAVLLAEELMERGVRFVADALLEVPSLLVSSAGPRGSLTQVRLRGSEANHVLVLIDGMRVSDASSGEYDLAQMTLDGIEKIEVLMGPQSTLYGNDAAAGVISITTLKGQGALAGKLSFAYGSNVSRSASAQVHGAKNGWHYSVAASQHNTKGISEATEKNGNTEEDGFDVGSMNLKAGYDHNAFQTWVNYNQNHSRYEFDGWDFINNIATDSALDRQWMDTQGMSWTLAIPLLDGRFNNQLQISNTRVDVNSLSAAWGASFRDTDRDVIDYQASYKLTGAHTLQFGAEHIEEHLNNGTLNRGIEMDGLYLQWLASLGALDLSVGARSDDHEQFGRHNTHRITASWQLDGQWRIRAAHGTGFKAPTLVELYDTSWGVNNPALKPEETSSVEWGLEYALSDYTASLTVFDQKTTNLIRLAGVWPASFNQNVNRADSLGVELAMEATWDTIGVNAGLTWMDATETDNAGVEAKRLRVPDWSANLMAHYYLPEGRVWAQAIYRDDRRDFGDNMVAEYWLFNLGVTYDLGKDISLKGRIENVADKEYEENFSYGTRGRSFTAAIDWRF